MRSPLLVDTNVPLTANGFASQADEACRVACIEKLIDIQAHGRVLVDAAGFIFREYSRQLSHRGQPGLGDAFFKWLWDNQGQSTICTQVPVVPEDQDGFEYAEFPSDPDLAKFDRSDRKFVATALAAGEPAPILNATDSDWLHFQSALNRHGIFIEFLCPDVLK